MVGVWILLLISGVLWGDIFGILSRRFMVSDRIRRYGVTVTRNDLELVAPRVKKTYNKIWKSDTIAFIIEVSIAFIATINAILRIDLIRGLMTIGGTHPMTKDEKICIAIITLSFVTVAVLRLVRNIKKRYILFTLSDISVLGIKCAREKQKLDGLDGNTTKEEKQLRKCESGIDTLYTIIDRIKTKEDYNKSSELKSNIEKTKEDIEILASMLKERLEQKEG